MTGTTDADHRQRRLLEADRGAAARAARRARRRPSPRGRSRPSRSPPRRPSPARPQRPAHASRRAVSSTPAPLASPIHRSGRMRACIASEIRPAEILVTTAPTWRTASDCRRGPRAQPVNVMEEEDEKRGERDLGEQVEPAARREHPETGVAKRPLHVLGFELGRRARRSRMATAATAALTRQSAPRKMNAAFRPPAAFTAGSATAASAPPIGIAVCRTPSANPRSPAGNQCMTARPLAELTLAPMPPATDEQHDEHHERVRPARAADEHAAGASARSPGRCARRPGRRAGPRAAASGSARPRRSRARCRPPSATGRTARGAPARAPAARSGPRRSSPAPPCRPRGRPSGSVVL